MYYSTYNLWFIPDMGLFLGTMMRPQMKPASGIGVARQNG